MNVAIVHLFYEELVDELIDIISRLPVQQIIATTCSESILEKVNQLNLTGWQITLVKNKGMDIGPFLLSLDKVDEKCEYIYKLHTKKDNIWRNDLLSGLFQSTNHRIFGSKKWYYTDNPNYNKSKIHELCKLIGIEYPNKKFIAGTIFAINKDLLFKYIYTHRLTIYDLLEEGYFNDTQSPKYTHSMERILSSLCYLEKELLVDCNFPNNFNGKFVFIPVPGCEDHMIKSILKDKVEIYHPEKDFQNHFKIVFIKNTTSRLITLFRESKSDNFDNWFRLNFEKIKPQTSYFDNTVNFVGHIDNIKTDLEFLSDMIKIEIDFTKIKNEPKEPVRIGLDVRKRIEKIFSSDYEKFGI